MSISEREQETLDSIGDGLARSAPKLASMLAMFSRLSADEEMPVREPVRRAARGLGRGVAATAGRVGPGRLRRCHPERWALPWLWLAAVVALLALALTLNRGTGSGTCTGSRVTACGQAPAYRGMGLPGGL